MSNDAPAAAAPSVPRPGRGFAAMCFMFFLSGVAALMCQIVWTNKLQLVFGVTLYATSAVVATFMAGLALGSVVFGGVADRSKNPLRLFALLEGGIAACAIAFPLVPGLLKLIYVPLYGKFGDSHYAMSLVRFALAFCALIVPTSLMGGTLPVITRAYVTGKRALGHSVASLYSANNIGAFIGCIAAGYLFLQMLGPVGTLWLAALLNLAAAQMALRLGKSGFPAVPGEPAEAEPEAEREPESQERKQGLSGPVKVALWVFGLEGVASLVYQMAWVRVLIFFVQSDIRGVVAIISTYLMGLALGAFVSRSLVDRLRSPYRALGFIEVGIGASALATIPLLPYLLGVHSGLLQLLYGALSRAAVHIGANFGTAFLVILVPTAFMGATLPVMSRIYVSERRKLGAKIGVLGCLDTVGSIAGAFAGGFLLIPLLGPQRTIILTALLNFGLAAAVFAVDPAARRRPARRRLLHLAMAGMLLTAVLMLLPPTPVIRYSTILKGKPMLDLVAHAEDQVASVSVVEQEGFARSLYVNDECVGDTSAYDRLSHEIEIHQTLLAHPNPKRILLIGLGLGLNIHTALAHGVEVDAVELSASVVRLHDYVDQERRGYGAGNVFDDPRVRVRVEDGRNYVLGTSERYDVIHVGGFHPLRSSSAASFYTVEFFEDCKRILNPGGHLGLWLPLHAMPTRDCRIILRSFHTAFPHGTVWHKHSADCCLLLGRQEPLAIDFRNYEARVSNPLVQARLARCRVSEPYDLLDSFCMGPETLGKIVGEGRVQTDRHPYIEYDLNRARPVHLMQNLEMLEDNRERVWPHLTNVPEERRGDVRARLETWFTASQRLIRARREEFNVPYGVTNATYREAMDLNPSDRNARFLFRRWQAVVLVGSARSLLEAGDREQATQQLRAAMRIAPGTRGAAEAAFLLKTLTYDALGVGPSAAGAFGNP